MLFVLDNYTMLCEKNCLDVGRVYHTLAKAMSACSSNGKCIGISATQIKDPQFTGVYQDAFRICYDGIYVAFSSCIFKKNNVPNGRCKVD